MELKSSRKSLSFWQFWKDLASVHLNMPTNPIPTNSHRVSSVHVRGAAGGGI